MIATDTNVLVRILVDDPGQPDQVASARRLASREKQLFIAQIVIIELVWVLQSAYKFDKQEIIAVLEHLLHNQAFILQSEARFHQALALYKANNCDFSDCIIAVESTHAGHTLFTFDKKLARLPGVQRVA